MNQPVRHQVADNVRAELARGRVRRADVCAAIGIGRTALWRRLSGDVPFNADELHTLAALLGVPASELLGEQLAEAPQARSAS